MTICTFLVSSFFSLFLPFSSGFSANGGNNESLQYEKKAIWVFIRCQGLPTMKLPTFVAASKVSKKSNQYVNIWPCFLMLLRDISFVLILGKRNGALPMQEPINSFENKLCSISTMCCHFFGKGQKRLQLFAL